LGEPLLLGSNEQELIRGSSCTETAPEEKRRTCFSYTSIGKKQSELAEIFDRLERFGVAGDKLLDKVLRLSWIWIEQEHYGSFA
jgi:hypothetical protein